VIKTINGERRRTDRERLRRACSSRSDILLVEDYLSSDQLTSLMAEATAYVSLHRSEGYGLTMAESMALGRPVIATGYSGNLDFMTEENSLLVPYRLVPVGAGAGPYPSTSHWAEPDVAVAAQHLRRVIDDPEFARDLGERARASVEQQGSLAVTADFLRARVAAITSDRRGARRRGRERRRTARRRWVGARRIRLAGLIAAAPAPVRGAAHRARQLIRRIRRGSGPAA